MAFLVKPIKTEKRTADPIKAATGQGAAQAPQQASQSAPGYTDNPARQQERQRSVEQQRREPTAVAIPTEWKRDAAQKMYDAYIQSDEYKQNLAASMRAQTDEWMQATLAGSEGYTPTPRKDKKEQELKALVDHYTAQMEQEANQATLEQAMRELEMWSPEERKMLEMYGVQRDQEMLNPIMNPVTGGSYQIAGKVAADLIAKYGEAKVNRMAEALKWQQSAEAAEAARSHGQEMAGGTFFDNVGADLLSIGEKGVGNLTGLMGYIAELGQRTGQFSTLNPNNIGQLPNVHGDAIQGQKAEKLAADGGKWDAYVYKGATSAADSALRMAMGGGAVGGAALAATGSFARSVSEASARGASPAEAAAYGAATAGIEYLTEKLPLDNLMEAAKTGGHTWKEIAKSVLIQGGIEATEEELSLIGTTLAEAGILKEKAGYQQRINELVAGGMPLAEAQNAAFSELMEEAKETAIVSALSGGLSQAGASAVGNLTQRPGQSAADVQQNAESAANTAAKEQMNADADNMKASEEQVQQDATPELTEKEKTDRTMEETAARWAQEAPKAAPKQKTEAELRLDQALAETFGSEGNDQGGNDHRELERLEAQEASLRGAADAYASAGDNRTAAEVEAQRQEYGDRVREAQAQENTRADSYTDRDAPAEQEVPYPGSRNQDSDPLRSRSWEEAGSRKTKAYMAENPDVKPFIQREAQAMAEELANTTKGERGYNEDVHYESGGEKGWWGTKRHTSEDIAELRDSGMSYEQIGKGLNDIIEDHGKENSAAAKRVEMQLNDRMRTGHKDFLTGKWVQPNQKYIYAVNEAEANRAGRESFDALVQSTGNKPAAETDNGSGVREQLRKNQEKLNAQVPVVQIQTPVRFSELSKSEKMNWVIEKLRPTNYRVDRKDFGVIKFTAKQLKSAFNYFGKGSVEEAAFEALPYVLQNGTEISSHADHKGREYETTTIAAPVVINGRRGNMAVVVKRTTENFYKVHRILTPEGSVFQLTETNEAASTPAGESPNIGSLATPINAASYTSISPNGEEVKGTGAAEQDFAGTAAYENLLSDDNVQRERKGAARSDEVPKYDSKGRPVSEFAGNSMSSRITPDSFTTTIKQMVADGWASHDIKSNDQSLREAAQAITDSGSIYDALQEVREVAKQGRTSSKDVAVAELIYNHLVNQDGEQEQRMAADAWVTLSQLATNSGRATQIFSVFQRMTPDSQCMVLEKEVKLFADRMKGKGNVPADYVTRINPELMKDYRKAADAVRKAKTEDAKQEAMEQLSFIQDTIYQAEAAKMPATFKAKWDAWRYMCMLGNVKTQARNFLGNMAFMPYKDVKDALGAGLERLARVDKSQRTKSVLNVASEGDRQLLAWAKEDRKTAAVQDALEYSAKVGDDVSASKMEKNRQVFETKGLEKARKIIEEAPAKADLFFKNGYYERSLAGFLKARGYSAADLQAGRVQDAVLNEARSYAVDEAMKATFNDCNAFSDFVSTFGRDPTKKDNPVAKVFNVAAEGVLPFRRTPANIVVRFTEYSPVGMAKGVWDAARSIHNGEVSAASAIDQMAAGVTGSGALALGFLLAKGLAGIKLAGSEEDKDEKRQGHQAYALEFAIDGKEYSYTIDWAAPANLPLFVGANLYDMIAGGDEENADVSKFTSFLYGTLTMFEPMLSLSCLSSLNDLFETGKYSDGNALYAVAAQAATSYLTQGIPTLARQAVQASQRNKQTTFANDADPLVRDLHRTAAATGIVPALKTDAIDEWGQKESQGGFLLRALNAFVNPGTLKEIDNSRLEQEVTRLNESQPDSVSPPDTPKTVSYTDKEGERHTGHRLTEEEYSTLAEVQGKTAKEILDKVLESDTYAAMTDQQKASVFEYVYDYAREKGRTAALPGYEGLDGWMKELDGNEVAGILDKAVKGAFTDAFDQLATDPEGAAAALDQAYSLVDQHGITEWAQEAGGRTKYFIDAKRRGIDSDTFLDLYQTFREIDENPDLNTSGKAAEWTYQLQKAQEAGILTKAQKKGLKDSMVYYQMFPAETAKFDQMTESGISADKALKIGDLLNGIKPQEGYTNVRDVQKAAALADSDLSRSEKTAAMKIYLSDAQDENLDLMLGLGYGPEDYAAVYEIYSGESGKGKKARTINKIREELGVDYGTAREIYEIYG